MRKVWLVAKREYLSRIRTKGFIISTIAVPLFSVGLLLLTTILTTRESGRTLKIAVLDNAGLGKTIAAGFTEKLKDGRPLFQLVQTLEQPQSDQKAREELAGEVRRGTLDGYLVVPKEVLEGKAVELHMQNPGDFQVVSSIRRAVDRAVVSRRLSNRGIQIDNVSELTRGVDITLIKVSSGGETEEKGQTIITALAIDMILYFTLLVYGIATMRSVLEEKTTRIIEILTSSARPFQLLSGKILGVAGVGFTQYLIWTLTGALISTYAASVVAAFGLGASVPQFHIPISLLIYAILFFLAGYFLYASLYAAVGAMVSSEEEAQHMQMPVSLLIVAGFMLFPAVMHDPNSRLSVVVSLIPFLSPLLMVFRIALQTPPFWQIAVSLALNFAATIGVVRLAAKIYRVGILMYGKRPSLAELLRWLKYT